MLQPMGSQRVGHDLVTKQPVGLSETSRHPEAHQQSPHWNKRHPCHTGHFKGFKGSVSRSRAKGQILEQIIIVVFLLTRVLGSQSVTQYIFLIIS